MAEHIDLASSEPEYTGNPYPFLAGLREQGPVTKVVVEGLAVWLVTRYEDIRDGLSDPRLSNDPELGDAVTRAVPWVGASDATGRHLLRVDPPDHTRMRRLVARAFTPRRIEAQLEWRHSRSLRALKHLPVTFSARTARRADRTAEVGR